MLLFIIYRNNLHIKLFDNFLTKKKYLGLQRGACQAYGPSQGNLGKQITVV